MTSGLDSDSTGELGSNYNKALSTPRAIEIASEHVADHNSALERSAWRQKQNVRNITTIAS
jgi:hypothetical protein